MAIAIHSTAIGMFPSRAQAEQMVCRLLGVGFAPDQLGIVLPHEAAPVATSQALGPTALWHGTMFRSLPGVEVPEEEVRYYEEALQEGRTLVMVQAGDRFAEAMDILCHCGGAYLAAY
jgi:hypothetical protein